MISLVIEDIRDTLRGEKKGLLSDPRVIRLRSHGLRFTVSPLTNKTSRVDADTARICHLSTRAHGRDLQRGSICVSFWHRASVLLGLYGTCNQLL